MRSQTVTLCLFFVMMVAHASPIKHVVFMMDENRSFDHLLGYLKSEIPDLDGITGDEFNTWIPGNESSGVVRVSNHGSDYDTPNAGHSFMSTLHEAYGQPKVSGAAKMDGFVWNQAMTDKNRTHVEQVMACQPVENIPVLEFLAKNFAVVDAWHAGHPGPTEVNRMFLHSSSSHGWVDNPDDVEYVQGFPQESMYHFLEQHNVSYRIYCADDISTIMFYDDMRNVNSLSNFRSFETFLSDAAAGNLPQVTYIEPRFFSIPGSPSTDMHPPQHSVTAGEQFIKQIYDALRGSPVWEETLLIVTFDEHGGLYDHVPPPTEGVPSPDNIVGKEFDFKFDRLGVRVPSLLISPMLDHQVVHKPEGPKSTSQYTHSSVLATIKDIFNISGCLTARDCWAGSFAKLLTKRSSPRKDLPMKAPEHELARVWTARMHDEPTLPVHDFHQSMMVGAAALNGEFVPDALRTTATELEGAIFVREHVKRHFERHGLRWGKDE